MGMSFALRPHGRGRRPGPPWSAALELGRHALRHGGRVRRGGEREVPRPVLQGAPRRGRARHQVRPVDRTRTTRHRRIIRNDRAVHPPGRRGQPAAAGRRRDRPLLHAPARCERADRGVRRRHGRAGARGQGQAPGPERGHRPRSCARRTPCTRSPPCSRSGRCSAGTSRRAVVPAARELGVALVPYSPLGRGFLTGSFADADKDLTAGRLPPPAAPLHRRQRHGQRGAAGAGPHGRRGPRGDARARSPWPGSSSRPRCTACRWSRSRAPASRSRVEENTAATRHRAHRGGAGAAGADRGAGGGRPLRRTCGSPPRAGSRRRPRPRGLELRQQLRLLHGELLVGDQPGLVQLPEVPDPLGDVGGVPARRGRGRDRRRGAAVRVRPPAPPPRTAATRAPARTPARTPRPPDPGRPAPAARPRPRSSRRCPSKTSGDRHSTPVSSDTGKLWSPAFHFADDAPVQNHRKRTVRAVEGRLPVVRLELQRHLGRGHQEPLGRLRVLRSAAPAARRRSTRRASPARPAAPAGTDRSPPSAARPPPPSADPRPAAARRAAPPCPACRRSASPRRSPPGGSGVRPAPGRASAFESPVRSG